MVDGLIRLFLNEETTGPINLGNPSPIPIRDLATEILQLTNSTSKIVFDQLPSDDPVVREPNIDRAREILHWEPSVDRKQGLEKTVEYFKNTLSR